MGALQVRIAANRDKGDDSEHEEFTTMDGRHGSCRMFPFNDDPGRRLAYLPG